MASAEDLPDIELIRSDQHRAAVRRFFNRIGEARADTFMEALEMTPEDLRIWMNRDDDSDEDDDGLAAQEKVYGLIACIVHVKVEIALAERSVNMEPAHDALRHELAALSVHESDSDPAHKKSPSPGDGNAKEQGAQSTKLADEVLDEVNRGKRKQDGSERQ